MTHNDWQALMPFYLSRTLPPDQTQALAAHLATCAECRVALEEWTAISVGVTTTLDAWTTPMPSLRLSERLVSPDTQRTMPVMLVARRPRIAWGALVASALVCFCIGGAALLGLRTRITPGTPNATERSIAFITNTARPELSVSVVMTVTPSATSTPTALRPSATFTNSLTPSSTPPLAPPTGVVAVPTDDSPATALPSSEAALSSMGVAPNATDALTPQGVQRQPTSADSTLCVLTNSSDQPLALYATRSLERAATDEFASDEQRQVLAITQDGWVQLRLGRERRTLWLWLDAAQADAVTYDGDCAALQMTPSATPSS
ncbi:MAG: zf-HC2 domain-containing protein [Armatimonadetes bacterium]|nr:zf-HC2 domain-containing protein [Anaerolineae bacterium]